jgi:hypothetical protein
MSDALTAARTQSVSYFVTMMEGVFEMNTCHVPALAHSPLTKPVLNQTLPAGFLLDLVKDLLKTFCLNSNRNICLI